MNQIQRLSSTLENPGDINDFQKTNRNKEARKDSPADVLEKTGSDKAT